MGLFGPPNIEKMKAKKNIKGLIKALWYKKDPKISKDAAIALGGIGDSSALAPIAAFLVRADREYAYAAINALGLIGDNRAIEPLINFIKREEADEKYFRTSRENIEYACEALGKICITSIVPLITLFASIGTHHRPLVIKAIGKTATPEALDWLITNMDKYDNKVKAHIIKALGRSGHRSAVEPLKIALKARDEDVHETAARALEELGWEPDQGEAGAYYWVAKRNWKKAIALGSLAIDPLITVLWDDGNDKVVRQASAEALAEIGTPSIEPVIAAIANPDDYWYRGHGCKRGMGNVWNHRDMRPRTLDYCVEMMVKIGVPAIEPLVAAYNEWNNARVHQVAFEVLDKLAWTPDHDETGALYWIVKGKWDKVVAIGSPAVDPLIAVINDVKDARQQVLAGIALNVKLPRRDISDARHVRQNAAKALVQIYHEGALDEQSKREILALRDTITRSHVDKSVENDKGCYTYHTDTFGVGVDFPL